MIEKFEKLSSNCGFAVVVLSADDEGRLAGGGCQLKPRARQNVILELGYFIGRLGRNKVWRIEPAPKDFEQPSDLAGLMYITLDDSGWEYQLANELKAAGYTVDTNLI